jgi:hypothetical protein
VRVSSMCREQCSSDTGLPMTQTKIGVAGDRAREAAHGDPR